MMQMPAGEHWPVVTASVTLHVALAHDAPVFFRQTPVVQTPESPQLPAATCMQAVEQQTPPTQLRDRQSLVAIHG